ncbi:MAG TPA: nitroreductase family protein [Actinomycetota bacterium]|nr:nitroreductase family protein [Actinomycetota bacterium]
MEVFDAVRTVLAVRNYSDRPVPDEVLDKILEAGRLSASAMNQQPWHFIVVKDRDRIAEIANHTPSGPYVPGAPVVVVVASEKGPLALSDCSRAIQAMILVAWSEGVGSNWVGFSGGLDGVRNVLGIPDNLDVIAVLPFGYPAQELGKGRKKRKERSEVVHREEFGRPWS